MALYNQQRRKVKRSKRRKETFVEPFFDRHQAGSLAYLYYTLNSHNDPVRQFIIIILQMKAPRFRVTNDLTYVHTANNYQSQGRSKEVSCDPKQVSFQIPHSFLYSVLLLARSTLWHLLFFFFQLQNLLQNFNNQYVTVLVYRQTCRSLKQN